MTREMVVVLVPIFIIKRITLKICWVCEKQHHGILLHFCEDMRGREVSTDSVSGPLSKNDFLFKNNLQFPLIF